MSASKNVTTHDLFRLRRTLSMKVKPFRRDELKLFHIKEWRPELQPNGCRVPSRGRTKTKLAWRRQICYFHGNLPSPGVKRSASFCMLDSLFSLFSNDLAIDLGTANTLIYVK